jgi:hypothetical protein
MAAIFESRHGLPEVGEFTFFSCLKSFVESLANALAARIVDEGCCSNPNGLRHKLITQAVYCEKV